MVDVKRGMIELDTALRVEDEIVRERLELASGQLAIDLADIDTPTRPAVPNLLDRLRGKAEKGHTGLGIEELLLPHERRYLDTGRTVVYMAYHAAVKSSASQLAESRGGIG